MCLFLFLIGDIDTFRTGRLSLLARHSNYNVLEVFLKEIQNLLFFIAQCCTTFSFQSMPAVVQTAQDQFHEMNLGDRLVKVDSLSILLRDNC